MANGTDIAKAYVQIIPSAEGIKGKLTTTMNGEAENAGKSAGGKFGGAFNKVLKGGAAFASVAIAGIGTVSAAVTNGAKQVAEYGDEIDKMSQKVGLSAESYQKWDYVMQISGTEMANMTTGLKTLTNKLDDAKNGSASAQETFARLGLSMDDLATMSREEVFAATITAFQGMEESAERAALANDLFGRSGQELAPLFNTTAEETAALMQEVQDLGGVMSGDSVKAAAAYKDALTGLQTAIGGLSRGFISELLPSLTKVVDGLSNLFSGNGGMDQIREGISEFAAKLSEELPKFAQFGGEILIALANAIIENLPTLLDAGADLIVTLAVGLIETLPTLLQKAPEIVITLATAIINASGQIIGAAAELIAKLAQGIAARLSTIVQKGREIVSNFVQGVRNALSQVTQIGLNIVQGIWNGISNGLSWIKNKITGWVGNVLSFIKGLFGIGSPSKVMRDEVGIYLAQGIGVGFEEEMKNVSRDMMGAMPNTLGLSASVSSMTPATSAASGALLMGDLAAIVSEIRNMKIYLDTGVLVGAVDAGLQVRAMTMERRALA